MIIYPQDLDIEKYHSAINPPGEVWLSKTSIKNYIEKGPGWFKKAYIDKSIEIPTPGGAAEGKALDCYLTEGADVFAKRYKPLPSTAPKKPDKKQRNAKKPSQETIDAIKWWDDWHAENPEWIELSDRDRAILHDAVAAVVRHPIWQEIEQCDAQLTCRRWSAGLGIGLQSRPDWLSADRSRLLDLKKTRDLDRFNNQAIDLDYHLQASIAGWCLAGDTFSLESATLVAVEWDYGARVQTFPIPHEALELGSEVMRKGAACIAKRLKTGDWMPTTEPEKPLEISPWKLDYIRRKIEEMS
jgi:hypothetical protein